jgi:hypothetical protein
MLDNPIQLSSVHCLLHGNTRSTCCSKEGLGDWGGVDWLIKAAAVILLNNFAAFLRRHDTGFDRLGPRLPASHNEVALALGEACDGEAVEAKATL